MLMSLSGGMIALNISIFIVRYVLFPWTGSQAFMNLGPPNDEAILQGNESDTSPDRDGTMLTFDFLRARFVKDTNGALATRLLLSHFSEYWKNLVGVVVFPKLLKYADYILTTRYLTFIRLSSYTPNYIYLDMFPGPRGMPSGPKL